MITVHVEITGKAEAMSQLDHLKKILGDFRPEMQKVGDALMDFFTFDVFRSEGSVFSAPWAPLKESYAEIKARKYGSAGILVASGKMRASYKLYTATDYLIIRNEATNKYGQYYGAFHQAGTSFMPARTLIRFDAPRLNLIKNIIVDSLNQRIKSL